MTLLADRTLALAIYGRLATQGLVQDVKRAGVIRVRHGSDVCSTC